MNVPAKRRRFLPSRRKHARVRAKAIRMPLMPSLMRRRLQCYLALFITDIAVLFSSWRPAKTGSVSAATVIH